MDTIGVGEVKAFAKKSGGAANFLQDSKHSILFSGDKEPRTVLLRRRKLGHWNGGFLFRIVPEEVECAIMDRPDGAGDAAAGNAGEGLGTEAGGDETITRTLNLAASMEDLATCLNDQDKLVEAEAMYRKALSLRTKAVGYEHLDTQVRCRWQAAARLKTETSITLHLALTLLPSLVPTHTPRPRFARLSSSWRTSGPKTTAPRQSQRAGAGRRGLLRCAIVL